MKSEMAITSRPESSEYAPYYGKYISLVPEGDILVTLERQLPDTLALLAPREADGDLRYAPGKWSVKEALGHVMDTERVFSYRALRIARNDKTPLAGFEQDDYVKYGAVRAKQPDRPVAGVHFGPQRHRGPVPRPG